MMCDVAGEAERRWGWRAHVWRRRTQCLGRSAKQVWAPTPWWRAWTGGWRRTRTFCSSCSWSAAWISASPWLPTPPRLGSTRSPGQQPQSPLPLCCTSLPSSTTWSWWARTLLCWRYALAAASMQEPRNPGFEGRSQGGCRFRVFTQYAPLDSYKPGVVFKTPGTDWQTMSTAFPAIWIVGGFCAHLEAALRMHSGWNIMRLCLGSAGCLSWRLAVSMAFSSHKLYFLLPVCTVFVCLSRAQSPADMPMVIVYATCVRRQSLWSQHIRSHDC